MRRSTIGAFDFESHLTDIGASTPRWKAALARSKPNSCTTLAIQPGKLPGMTCSLTSKDITIVSGYIPPSGISLPNRQSAKPLDPVSTKSGEGQDHQCSTCWVSSIAGPICREYAPLPLFAPEPSRLGDTAEYRGRVSPFRVFADRGVVLRTVGDTTSNRAPMSGSQPKLVRSRKRTIRSAEGFSTS